MSSRNDRILACCVGVFLAMLLGLPRVAAQDPFINASGGVSDMLIIGPVDPGRNTSPDGRCSDGGRLETVDYLSDADGTVDETNILVAEGDDVTPDFGNTVDAVGVKLSVNPDRNPDAFDGVLTVWRADADLDGYINYNDADNLGDPVDDYIIYSLAYLDNTTDECLPAVLEVASDDAVKVRFNGALVHVNNICRGIPAAGNGDRVPVVFWPGVNVVLIAVVERGGGTGVRLILRDENDFPLTDGSVQLTLDPPASYIPGSGTSVVRAFSGRRYQPLETVTVTLTANNVDGAVGIVETFPAGWSVTGNPDNGVVADNTITFDIDADAELSYELTVPDGFCELVSLSGTVSGVGECAGGVTGDSDLRCSLSAYENAVLEDNPFAYWRLGEEDGFVAENLGTGLDFLNGTYTGGVMLGEVGLLFNDPDASVGFEFDGEVQIPDDGLLNTGGPYQGKSIELWFQSEPPEFGQVRRMLFEEGGTTRGLNMWVEDVNDEPHIFMSGWNRAQQSWEPLVVSAPIEEGRPHHAVLVFDASEDDDLLNFDGRITGYLDGAEIGTVIGAAQLYAHGDDAAIGGVHVNTLYPDLTNPGDGDNFVGFIDEVSLYNYALDDPNDDNDREDSRVVAHFQAGSDPACPVNVRAERDGSSVKLTWTPGTTAPASVRVVRNSTEIAAAAPADPPEFVDAAAEPGILVYELSFAGLAQCRPLRARFDGCITDFTANSRAGRVLLSWTNNFQYEQIEVWRDDQIIATIGGGETTYSDLDPPVGMRTYSVVPSNGDCDRTGAEVRVLEPGYAALVVEDGADGYWRLGEPFGSVIAANFGAGGPAMDGTYTGEVNLESDSLLDRVPDNTAMSIEGLGSVAIPNSDRINLGGPFTEKTIELWFQADVIDIEARILFEEGGSTRGINVYVQENFDGEKQVVMAGWNLAQEAWGVVSVAAPIEEGEVYHAVMVFVASEDEIFGNFDGRITGYLNGEEIGTEFGADRLYAHSNANAIGTVAGGQALLADGTNVASGGFFIGTIDEVAHYNLALDDPNLDGNTDDSRVEAHFLAGTSGVAREICNNGTDDDGDGDIDCADTDCAGSALCTETICSDGIDNDNDGATDCADSDCAGMLPDCPVGVTFLRGDATQDGNLNITDAVRIFGILFLGEPDIPCQEAKDVNDDGAINITDGIRVLGFLFLGQPAPEAPGHENCGPDPEGSPDLGCEAHPACEG